MDCKGSLNLEVFAGWSPGSTNQWEESVMLVWPCFTGGFRRERWAFALRVTNGQVNNNNQRLFQWTFAHDACCRIFWPMQPLG